MTRKFFPLAPLLHRLAVGLLLLGAAQAQAAHNVTIVASGSSSGGAWVGDTWTASADDSTVLASEVATHLGNGSTLIDSGSGGAQNGDIAVNSTLSWSAHTLTLNAFRHINLNTALNASVTAGLALQYGQGAVAAGNAAVYNVNAPVNLAATGSFATKLGSDGTVKNYTILTGLGNAGSTSGADLQGMSGGLAGNYALGANIDASGTSTWNSNGSGGYYGFAPVANNVTNFTGSFDGLSHTISGLTINRPSISFVGLFGWLNSAQVQNVGLTGVNITGGDAVGALAGNATVSSTVSNSYATGSVTGTGGSGIFTSYGGLLGVLVNSTLSNSYATATVTGVHRVGGLVGTSFGTVSNSYASGTVSGARDEVGGLVGYTNGTVSGRYATGSVTGNGAGGFASRFIGGLVGNSIGAISNSYATGAVSGTDALSIDAGGLVGFISGGTVSNSYATGTASSGSNTGGLAGRNIGTVTGSFWDVTTSGTGTGIGASTVCAGTGDCFGMTTVQMKVQSNFTSAAAANNNHNPNWSTATWRVYDTTTYPLLKSFMTALTVTANNASKIYDGAAYSGGNGVTYSATPNSNLLGTASYGGTSQGAINLGSYSIVPGGLYSNQHGYDIAFAGGTLSIVDTTPDAFAFTDQTGVALLTLTASNIITVAGIDSAAAVTVSGGEYRINGGAWTAAAGTVSVNDTVQVRHTSSGSYSTTVNTVLSIGGVTDTFSTTTVAAPVNGACGSANGTFAPNPPTANLCASGSASNVTGTPTGSGPWNWSCSGSNGGVTASCLVNLYVAPPAEPEPPPPPPLIVVGSGGTTTLTGTTPVTAAPGSTLVIPAGANVAGVAITLAEPTGSSAAAAITFRIGSLVITISGYTPGTVVSFEKVRVNGVETLVLAARSGSMNLSGTAGQPLLTLNGTATLIAGDAHTAISFSAGVGGGGSIVVTEGYIVLSASAFASRSQRAALADRIIYAGEQALWDNNGLITEVRLGSAAGRQNGLGDPLAVPTVAGLSFQATSPKLDGIANRSGQDLRATLGNQLRDDYHLSQQGNTDAFGSFRLSDGKQTLSVLPIGRVGVDIAATQPDGLTAPGNGDFALTRSHLTITLAPSVADLAALAIYYYQRDGSLTVQADGTYLVEMNGQQIILQAGYALTQGDAAGMGRDAVGNFTWTDSQGRKQTLYPATADFPLLQAEALKLDATAQVRGNADGTVSLTINGQRFTLTPDYPLTLIPLERFFGPAWWIGTDGKLYLRSYNLIRAQGFKVK